MKRLTVVVFTLFALASIATPNAPAVASCPTDGEGVALCGRCGDGFCNPHCGENQFTCPKDCQGVPQ